MPQTDPALHPLVVEIERFLGATGMAPSDFGLQFMGDRSFVFELRQGRDLRYRTEQKLRAQMAAYREHVAVANLRGGEAAASGGR
jgi:hypothetical protein